MIPLADLPAQYRSIRAEIDEAIRGVVERGEFVLGPAVAAFERDFAAYCGAAHAVAVSSGTSALRLALASLGIGPGDEVVTVPFTFVATVAAIQDVGATPVFVDVDPHTLTIDPSSIEGVLTPRTRALLPVHLYGHPADMDPILALARAHDLAVIEDAAQAHGARYKGRRTGSLGHLGCFSFYPSKNLGAFGEAGMVVTDDEGRARTIRLLRDWGQEGKYNHVLRGHNERMDGIQGAVLGVKLRYLDRWNATRRALAAEYDALIGNQPTGLVTLRSAPWAEPVYHVYAVRAPERDRVRAAMAERGIQTGVHYPVPVHLQPSYGPAGQMTGKYLHAEKAAREVLSLPLYPELTNSDVRKVAEALLECVRAAHPVRP
jgi:dTDP-4-amino-4,6-dideoxygalactose transaminase